ncbi:MAG: coproporphyrinogen III oxidase, partial [Rhodocyclaceae bacterium]
QALMCHFEIDIAKVEREYGIDFASYFAPDLADLQTMAKEELIALDDKRITVLPRGRMLVRVIAMAFDRYLRYERAHARYSKVI